MQTSFSELEYASKHKVTRRNRFLSEIEAIKPWGALGIFCASIVLPTSAGLLSGVPFDSCSVLLSDRPSPEFDGVDTGKTVKHRPLSLDIWVSAMPSR
jgi:hypothetical protein|tara:strand:+ start:460 stop:753 length:294 start_codon:yes stop_codon:yes gene_type:complete